MCMDLATKGAENVNVGAIPPLDVCKNSLDAIGAKWEEKLVAWIAKSCDVMCRPTRRIAHSPNEEETLDSLLVNIATVITKQKLS